MTESKRAREHTSKAIEDLAGEITSLEQARTDKKMMLALKIGQALNTKGWNSKRFAEEMMQQPSVISKWLSGTHNFTADTLSDIEEKLGIELLATQEPERTVTKVRAYRIAAQNKPIVAEDYVHPYVKDPDTTEEGKVKKPFSYG